MFFMFFICKLMFLTSMVEMYRNILWLKKDSFFIFAITFTYGSRSFAFSGPTVWNKLYLTISEICDSPLTFSIVILKLSRLLTILTDDVRPL